ncbi:MAG: FecR domain-containing protein, partial [Chitinophagaceae bacterium]|nr:FecR domain-containing protein [Chitinophagaceae bacterium]
MTDQAFHIISLLKKELYGEITAGEKTELESWRAQNSGFTEEELINEYGAAVNEMYLYNKEAVRNKIAGKYPQVIEEKLDGQRSEKVIAPVHRIHFLKTTWFRYAAAVLLIIGISTYFWNRTSSDKTQPAKTTAAKQDVQPGFNRATLTLSDGKKIALDSAKSETIKDKTISIGNNNGQLIYSAEPPIPSLGGVARSAGVGSVQQFNTMSTPRGGQYQLTLSDGTRVWLNAASSITYPTSFTEKIRQVSITGEAYFEVSTNKSKPFVVSVASLPSPFEKGGSSDLKRNTDGRGIYQITVLGTEFNVNAYPDEPYSKTSLISGSVRVSENPPADLRSPQTSATPFFK